MLFPQAHGSGVFYFLPFSLHLPDTPFCHDTKCRRASLRLCEPVWPSGEAGKQKGLRSIPLWLSFFVKKVVVCGHCLVTLSLTINEILKWLSSLPVVVQESFCW